MNERIKQLSEQVLAENYAIPDYSMKLYTEKFAKLIIEECMDCSTWVGKMNTNPVEPIHTAHAINKRIKKHFGVEE